MLIKKILWVFHIIGITISLQAMQPHSIDLTKVQRDTFHAFANLPDFNQKSLTQISSGNPTIASQINVTTRPGQAQLLMLFDKAKKFRRSDRLSTKIQKKFSREYTTPLYKCSDCTTTFTNSKNRLRHLRKFHDFQPS